MRYQKLATASAGLALAAALLAGCSSSPPEEKVAVVTPPVVAVPTPAPQPSSHMTIGMLPTDTPGVMRLQSFAGDVCIQDNNRGTTEMSHCICQQTTCNCQSTGTACTPQ
ncbi:MAG TPA: hypothetical protein VF816_09220 [Rhodocyclaceae bacterium]